MTSVRFLYTSQPGKGFTELTIPDPPDLPLRNWLKENLRQPHSPSYTRTLNKGLSVGVQDGWVICTYLTRQMDDNNRPFIRNHSVLVPEAEYNQLARNFDQAILVHIEEGDETALVDGELKPLRLPDSTRNGLEKKDMEAVAGYFGQELEKLLASLISGKPFSVRIRGATEDAIDLATTLLKTAALGELPVPQISTFEPGPKTRSWYPSQVFSSSQGRVDIQFQQKSPPDREAMDSARRLVQSVANLDPDGVASSMHTARNHAEVTSDHPPATVNPLPALEARTARTSEDSRNKGNESATSRRSDNSRASGNESRIYQYNKEYEAALDSKKEELDAQKAHLIRQEHGLQTREREWKNRMERELEERRQALQEVEHALEIREENVSQKENEVKLDQDHIKQKEVRLGQWRVIYEVLSLLARDGQVRLEERVLNRFFDEIKRLNPETLKALDEGVRSFIPSLERVADENESQKETFLKDIEAIKKSLQRNDSERRRY